MPYVIEATLLARPKLLRLNNLLKLSQDFGAVLGQVADHPRIVEESLEVAHNQDEVQHVSAMGILDLTKVLVQVLHFPLDPGNVLGAGSPNFLGLIRLQ